MISKEEYIIQSLETHLFFARILKEHAFFLQVSFPKADELYIKQSFNLRQQFERLLGDVIYLSKGVVSKQVLNSGELITPFTLDAERVTMYYTGINLETRLTEEEARLTSYDPNMITDVLEKNVNYVNQVSLTSITSLIELKKEILADVLSCKIFTSNYPSLIEHILHEAELYLSFIIKLQNRESISFNVLEQEVFWNHIMGDHAKFIHGLLDPSEDVLIKKAEYFAEQFEMLTNEAIQSFENNQDYSQLKLSTIQATRELRDFKEKGIEGILGCKIKSIILPLLADHVLREANYYLRFLKS